MVAGLTGANQPSSPILLVSADEAHPTLTPLFDPSVTAESVLADGGGAFVLQEKKPGTSGPEVALIYDASPNDDLDQLLATLGGIEQVFHDFSLLMIFGHTLVNNLKIFS